MKDADSKIFSPWNPLNYGQLLLWMMLRPSRLRAAYKGRLQDRIDTIGRWLIAILIWFPWLTLMVHFALGRFGDTGGTQTWIFVGATLLAPILSGIAETPHIYPTIQYVLRGIVLTIAGVSGFYLLVFLIDYAHPAIATTAMLVLIVSLSLVVAVAQVALYYNYSNFLLLIAIPMVSVGTISLIGYIPDGPLPDTNSRARTRSYLAILSLILILPGLVILYLLSKGFAWLLRKLPDTGWWIVVRVLFLALLLGCYIWLIWLPIPGG